MVDFSMVQQKLDLISKLIDLTDAETHQFLCDGEASTSFAVVWLLTWFARVPGDFEEVVRITDFIMATDTVYMPIYMSTVAVLLRKKEILAGVCDMPTIFNTILKGARIPTQKLLSKSWDLYCRLPVPTLLQFTSTKRK